MLTSKNILSAVVLASFALACEPTNQGYAPKQPIEYSHAVHAGAMEIPCEYCHFAAESSRHAGIPPAQVCMNCHEQVVKDHPEVLKVRDAIANNEPIKWVRVHDMPDHVYFNHSIHVQKDISCQRCHGPVQSMGRVTQWETLSMGWCIDCHRTNDEPPLGAPKDAIQRGGPLTDCGVCHH